MINRDISRNLSKKLNHKKSTHKKHYYNLYKNPFIDLTDDEEDTKRVQIEIERENKRINKFSNINFKIIPIYQEDFHHKYSLDSIFHRYKIFNKEIKGLYSNKRMTTLFENLFKNYNNMFYKKTLNRNRTFSDIKNKNRMNTLPLLSNPNNKRTIDSLNSTSINRFKRYSSLDNILNSLKNEVFNQRKKINNKILINLNKNKNMNISYIKDNIIDSNNNRTNNNLIQNLSTNNLKNKSNYNSLNLIKRNNINDLHILKNLTFHKNMKKKKIISHKDKEIIRELNKYFVHKGEFENKRNNISLINNNKNTNSLLKYYLKNKNKLLIQIHDKIPNINNPLSFENKKGNKMSVNEILIKKYSKYLSPRIKLKEHPINNY